MANLALRDLRKSYGRSEVLHGIDLEVDDGEFVVFVGPSGCGKSTTLRLIAGLEEVTSGEVRIGDRMVNNLEPKQRDIAMVFQNYAIYPHMSVRKNIGFGLRTSKMAKNDKETRIDEVAALLGMTDLLDRKPSQLSGGQRQRVAIGRAMVRNPAVFLFDEPLSNLDAQLRTQMRLEIKKLHQRVGSTIVFVTHDQVEAMTMADRIVIMKDGHIQQIGTPAEVYHAPNNIFVAQFIGAPSMNLLSGRQEQGQVTLFNGASVPCTGEPASGAVTVGVRPEDLQPGSDGELQLEGIITVTEPLGAESLLYVDVDGHEVIASGPGRHAPEAGARIQLSARSENLHLFDTGTGEAIR
ncbi:ABC transporter ATP-binding protein [Qingshengfaniella alkalisoli]|uniref:sn-glycerol-3-phosphate ABC transporter ATP-binding protein UgpC n=1 Tax=Qingshengfaniella alkalisoli TaxID=2599296 RepID=A0A5B8IYK1_9RHOB|nr:sn-glycerol-3-phosphate ABC transporter ATP-binding protein UgpC [Qingshengfaniella alkalisoli]QDY70663.1 sn-glycerol-3-phosphate ABC transporter ATP-binding protein UgpC [Qingshengfaniella alkalisoli]